MIVPPQAPAIDLDADGSSGVLGFAPTGPVASVADAGNGLVVVGAYDKSVSVVDVPTGWSRLLGRHDLLVAAVATSPSGRLAASASADHTVLIWNLLEADPSPLALVGHEDDVEAVAFLDERTVVSGSRDWTVRVWDLRTGACRVLRGHDKDVLSVGGDPTTVVSCGDDMTLRVWSRETGACLRVIGPFDVETDTCALDPVRGHVVLGADDGVVRVFALADGSTLAEREAHRCAIKRIAVSPDGSILSAAYDQALRIWTPGLMPIASLPRPGGVWERSLTWARSGARIFGGTFDGTLVEWAL